MDTEGQSCVWENNSTDESQQERVGRKRYKNGYLTSSTLAKAANEYFVVKAQLRKSYFRQKEQKKEPANWGR